VAEAPRQLGDELAEEFRTLTWTQQAYAMGWLNGGDENVPDAFARAREAYPDA
jgi:hypothetical protein